jgi:hypothetical protein
MDVLRWIYVDGGGAQEEIEKLSDDCQKKTAARLMEARGKPLDLKGRLVRTASGNLVLSDYHSSENRITGYVQVTGGAGLAFAGPSARRLRWFFRLIISIYCRDLELISVAQLCGLCEKEYWPR